MFYFNLPLIDSHKQIWAKNFSFFYISILPEVCILTLAVSSYLWLWAIISSLIAKIFISNLDMFYFNPPLIDPHKQIRAKCFGFFYISIFPEVCILTLVVSSYLWLWAIISSLIVEIFISNFSMIYFNLPLIDPHKQIWAKIFSFFKIAICIKVCIVTLPVASYLWLWAIISSLIVEIYILNLNTINFNLRVINLYKQI